MAENKFLSEQSESTFINHKGPAGYIALPYYQKLHEKYITYPNKITMAQALNLGML